MISFKKVEKWSIGYAIVKLWVCFFHNIIFYKKVYIHNFKNVPRGKAVILAPNHQNALMDALAIVNTIYNWQPVFLARADIFRKKTTAVILRFLKIMPIFRMRDGMENLHQNDEIFKKSVQILQQKKILTVLPEGNHDGFRRLRPLKKGIARIAFGAEEAEKFSLDLQIVPMGLDYSHYQNIRTTLFINYGKPIAVADFYEQYQKNPQQAMNALRERLSEEMKPLMIHIENELYYDMYDHLRKIYNSTMRKKMGLGNSIPEKFEAEKKIIEKLDACFRRSPDVIEKLNDDVCHYISGLKRYRFRDWLFNTTHHSTSRLIFQSLLLLLGLPIFLFGGLNHYPLHKLILNVVRNIKDKQFHSSIKFVLAMALTPLYYLLIFSIIWIVSDIRWLKFAYIGTMIPTAWFAIKYYIWFKKTRTKFRYNSLIKNQNESVLNLYKLRNSIFNKMEEIVV